jgi:hypothetical protein
MRLDKCRCGGIPVVKPTLDRDWRGNWESKCFAICPGCGEHTRPKSDINAVAFDWNYKRFAERAML